MYNTFFKRFLDFVIASIGFIILLPVFILVTLLLTFFNKGNPFFLQIRPGKNEQVFKVIKFKTMNDNCDSQGNLFPDAERLTAIGKFVRKTSLDELPQLINVVKGDMSLVGPRPILVEYLPLYDSQQKRRHEIRPGITGWAQINGRNTLSWKQKFDYDIWYIDNISFLLDLRIILLTIKKVFKSEGISSKTSITMEKFNGTN